MIDHWLIWKLMEPSIQKARCLLGISCLRWCKCWPDGFWLRKVLQITWPGHMTEGVGVKTYLGDEQIGNTLQGVPKNAHSELPFWETVHGLSLVSSQLVEEGHVHLYPVSQNANSESVFFLGHPLFIGTFPFKVESSNSQNHKSYQYILAMCHSLTQNLQYEFITCSVPKFGQCDFIFCT